MLPVSAPIETVSDISSPATYQADGRADFSQKQSLSRHPFFRSLLAMPASIDLD
jgi:hypothetical protein